MARRLPGALAVLATLVASPAVFTSQSGPRGSAEGAYEATIRRTAYGIPHISAGDVGSLAFGEAYALAQDHACSLADQVVFATGERAKYFGAGVNDRNLHTDITVKALRVAQRAAEALKTASAEHRETLRGYAAGYNAYLAEVGADGIPGWCRGAAWVRPLRAEDVAARTLVYGVVVPPAGIATASPPAAGSAAAPVDMPDEDAALSNGWAIGKERSETGGGLLLANPHYPWVGSNRFWEHHLTIPGRLDVYGVQLIGAPGISIGFNRYVAWTHTISAAERLTGYSLQLVPGTPTSYVYDGQTRAMTSREVEIDVRQSDGSLKRMSRTVYFSHHGPIVNLPGLPWTRTRAIAVRATGPETALGSVGTELGLASNFEQVKRALRAGTAATNVMLATADGRAYYIDPSATPYLSETAIKWWKAQVEIEGDVKAAYARGVMLLDGADSRFEWVNDKRARVPGLVPTELAPQLERPDYIFNANDSHWLSHARVPLTGFAPAFGTEGTARSLRTRMNARLLDDSSPAGASGRDGRFSVDEIWAAAFSNRSMSAELLRAPLAERCRTAADAAGGERRAPLAAACRILAEWDGTFNLDSRGAVLWREFVTQFRPIESAQLYATPFDAADPLGTPRGLAAPKDGKDIALDALARAIEVLNRAGLPLDVPLGQVQFAQRGQRRIPVHGGLGGEEGIGNFVNYAPNTTTTEPDAPRAPLVEGSRFLTRDGYPVNRGSSFVMAVGFTNQGPRGRAVLTYGQSGDPQSPHFSDQTELFSRKGWRELLFTEDQIRADKTVQTKVVTGRRP